MAFRSPGPRETVPRISSFRGGETDSECHPGSATTSPGVFEHCDLLEAADVRLDGPGSRLLDTVVVGQPDDLLGTHQSAQVTVDVGGLAGPTDDMPGAVAFEDLVVLVLQPRAIARNRAAITAECSDGRRGVGG